jgi:erythromycin esterase
MIRFLFVLSTLLFSFNGITQVDYPDSVYVPYYDVNKKIDRRWEEEIREQSIPFYSLTSDDYSDLAFLKETLSGKEIIFLGENSHCVKEYNQLRIRIIKYLHEQMGVNVIAFETSMTNAAYVSEYRASLSPEQMTKAALYKMWQSRELVELMSYLKEKPELKLIGFDPQESKLDTSFVTKTIEAEISVVDKQLAQRYHNFIVDFLDHTSELPFDQSKPYHDRGMQLKVELSYLSRIFNAFPNGGSDYSSTLLAHIKNLGNTLDQWEFKSMKEGTAFRDRKMADNIQWIKDEYIPSEKMVCWGHNVHIAKDAHVPMYPESTGQLTKASYPGRTYHIGMYAFQGVHGQETAELLETPKRSHLENILHQNQFNYSFFPLHNSDMNSWQSRPIKSLNMGYYKETLVASKAYDAVILIDTISQPDYLVR